LIDGNFDVFIKVLSAFNCLKYADATDSCSACNRPKIVRAAMQPKQLQLDLIAYSIFRHPPKYIGHMLSHQNK
jgi:hypothetical protein